MQRNKSLSNTPSESLLVFLHVWDGKRAQSLVGGPRYRTHCHHGVLSHAAVRSLSSYRLQLVSCREGPERSRRPKLRLLVVGQHGCLRSWASVPGSGRFHELSHGGLVRRSVMCRDLSLSNSSLVVRSAREYNHIPLATPVATANFGRKLPVEYPISVGLSSKDSLVAECRHVRNSGGIYQHLHRSTGWARPLPGQWSLARRAGVM